VLRAKELRFAGTPDELLRTMASHRLTVSTEHALGVRAIAEPFEVSIQQTPEGLEFRASEGQELAAKLLLEGYGDVRFVIARPATFAEALHAL
jgi:hypothetical protein